jgi:hypothetical protein
VPPQPAGGAPASPLASTPTSALAGAPEGGATAAGISLAAAWLSPFGSTVVPASFEQAITNTIKRGPAFIARHLSKQQPQAVPSAKSAVAICDEAIPDWAFGRGGGHAT